MARSARRTRMVPPCRSGDRARPARRATGRPFAGPALTQIPSNKLQTDNYSSQPVRRFKAGLFMAFSQARDRSWVRLAALATLVTVAAVVARFGLNPQTPAFCHPSPPGARPCPP